MSDVGEWGGTVLINGGSGTLSVPDPPLIKPRDRTDPSPPHLTFAVVTRR